MKPTEWGNACAGFFAGATDVAKAVLWLPERRRYHHLPLSAPSIFLVLLLLGWARNFFEVVCLRSIPGSERWYSLSPNIQFAVSLWPFNVCFLSAGVAFVFGLLWGRRMDKRKLVALCFYLQLLHLIAAPCDWLGNVALGMGFVFIAPPDAVTDYYAVTSKMYLGDFVTYGLFALTLGRLLVRDFRLRVGQSVLVVVIILNLIYWPTSHFFSTFNMAFKYLTGLWHAHWIGYGLYSLAAGMFGLLLLASDRIVPRWRRCEAGPETRA